MENQTVGAGNIDVDPYWKLNQESVGSGRSQRQAPSPTPPLPPWPRLLSDATDTAQESDVNPYRTMNQESVESGRSPQPSVLRIEADERSSTHQAPAPARPPSLPPVLSDANAAAQEFRTRVGQQYLPLYHAATRGDWESATSFIGHDTNLWTARITALGETVLIVATGECQWQFVEKLVQLLPPEALAMADVFGNTALHAVAIRGSVKTAKALVRKNDALPQITAKDGYTPLLASTQRPRNREMVRYLTSATIPQYPSPTCPFTGTMSGQLLRLLTASGYNDVTLHLVRRYSDLATAVDVDGNHLLKWLSSYPWPFLSGSKLKFWEKWIYKFAPAESEYANTEGVEQFIGQEQVEEAKLQHICAVELVKHVCQLLVSRMSFQEAQIYLRDVVYAATSSGNMEILRSCVQHFPDLIWYPVAEQHNMLHVAVECRQDKVFNLINERPIVSSVLASIRDELENNAWHLAAKLAPAPKLFSVSGAALQMQREVQWFKEVEKLIRPAFRNVKNKEGQTAEDIFRKEHEDLAIKGEKWMKVTANSSMIVSTLIATVVFAAVFTVPGGNINEKGIPIFLQDNLFLVFAVSDALALFSSSTSLLMFLVILTARYEPQDFLLALPKRLIIGLGSLFFSIITMMVAFGSTLFIVLGERWQWVYIPIILLSTIPITTFGLLQLPLFIQMVQSTYGSSIFVKSSWNFPAR